MKKLILLIFLFAIHNVSFCQKYFDIKAKLKKAVDENEKPMTDPYTLQPIELSIVRDVFKKFQKDGWIEFRYPQNECQYRAHAVARMLLENGIKSNKIWSFKPALLGENKAEQLSINDPNFPDEKVLWAYHVAPILIVKMPNNTIDTLALDPSMFDEPVPIKKWLGGLNCKDHYYTIVNSRYVQYETNPQNVLTGKWYNESHAVDMRWISTSICKGRIFYSFIENEIKPIYSQIQQIDTELQKTIGISQRQKDGLELNKNHLVRIYNERKGLAMNSANFGKLPIEYQSMLIDCQETLMPCIYWYWDGIESNQVLNRCKY